MKTIHVMFGLSLLMTPVVSLARVAVNPLLCEAQQLRKESAFHNCLARCDRRSEKSEKFDATRCEEGCGSSFQAALERVGRKAVCADAPADQQQCEAKMLKTEARHLVCESRCQSKSQRRASFDGVACLAICDQDYLSAVDEGMGSALCAEGRMSSEP